MIIREKRKYGKGDTHVPKREKGGLAFSSRERATAETRNTSE
jgi:hypothetical protein